MNIKSITGLSLLVVLSAFITACATNTMTKNEKTEAYDQFIASEKLEELISITTFRYDGWSSLGIEHLIISTSFNKPYLIKLTKPCHDLSFAETIAIHNMGSTLRAKFDSISVLKDAHQKCYIDAIYKLTKEQKEAIRKIGKEDISQ